MVCGILICNAEQKIINVFRQQVLDKYLDIADDLRKGLNDATKYKLTDKNIFAEHKILNLLRNWRIVEQEH